MALTKEARRERIKKRIRKVVTGDAQNPRALIPGRARPSYPPQRASLCPATSSPPCPIRNPCPCRSGEDSSHKSALPFSHRIGISRHYHPPCPTPRHRRRPRLVQLLYPLPTGNLPRPVGSPPQLPNPGARAYRHGNCKCLPFG